MNYHNHLIIVYSSRRLRVRSLYITKDSYFYQLVHYLVVLGKLLAFQIYVVNFRPLQFVKYYEVLEIDIAVNLNIYISI